jgi:hypothetical protein
MALENKEETVMKVSKSRMMVGIGIILLVTFFVGTHQAAGFGHVVPNPATDPLVMLHAETTNGLWPEEMTRILADGSSTTPFRVPARKVLVVTDITWAGAGANATATAGLYIANLQDDNKVQYGPFAGFTFGPPVGQQSVTQTFSTGFVVSEQAKIFPFFKETGVVNPGALGQFQVWVMGYLRAAP